MGCKHFGEVRAEVKVTDEFHYQKMIFTKLDQLDKGRKN